MPVLTLESGRITSVAEVEVVEFTLFQREMLMCLGKIEKQLEMMNAQLSLITDTEESELE